MATSSPVDVLLQFIVQTEWERVEIGGSSAEAFLSSVCRTLGEFVNIRDYQEDSRETGIKDSGAGSRDPYYYYSYCAFDRRKERLIHHIRDVRVRSLFGTHHFANETLGIEDGGQFTGWDTLFFTFLIYSTSVLLWDGALEDYEDCLCCRYHLPATTSLLRRNTSMMPNHWNGEKRDAHGQEEDAELPEGAQTLRDAMKTFLPLFPSVHVLERQPALLAALGNLAKCVWSAQEQCHGGGEAEEGGVGKSTSEVVCPLCYAAAADHILAAEAFLSLLEYHYVVNCYTANSHLQLLLLPSAARRPSSPSLRGQIAPLSLCSPSGPQVHLGVARRRCSAASGDALLSAEVLPEDVATDASHWWTAAETRADAQAKKTLWRHVLALGRVCAVNGSELVLRRLLHVWVFSTLHHTELFTCTCPSKDGEEESALASSSVVLSMTPDIMVKPARLMYLLLSLYVQDEAALQQLVGTAAGSRALAQPIPPVLRSAEDTYYSLYTLKQCFAPMYTSMKSGEGDENALPFATFLPPDVLQEAQEALHYHVQYTVYPALATSQQPQGCTVLAWLASRSHTAALRLFLSPTPTTTTTTPVAAAGAGVRPPPCEAGTAALEERDAVEQIVFVSPPPAPPQVAPAALPSVCPSFSPAATLALTEAVAARDLAAVRLLLLSGASRYALPLSALLVALQDAGEQGAGTPSVALWRMLHRPLQMEGPPNGREVAGRLKAGRCPTAAADLLAELAARLWHEKVQYLGHDDAAHDRVLRPCLAALSYDPLHPQARIVLVLVLQAKLLGWLRPMAADEEAVLAAPLPYAQLVLRLYQQLTTEEALRGLHEAMEVQCTLDAVWSQREARQQQEAAAEDGTNGGEAEVKPTLIVSASLVPDYATIVAAKEEMDVLLDHAIERASSRMQRASTATSPPARSHTLASERDPENPLYVLVTLSSLLRHPSSAAVTSPAPSRWYHCRHRRRRDLLAAMALAYLQPEREEVASVELWARVAPLADLDATLRQHGGVYAVLDHDVPPASPAQLGDLYLIVRGAGTEGGAAPVWECVDVLSFYSTAMHRKNAVGTAEAEKDTWTPAPPIESVDLKVSLVGRSPAPPGTLSGHLRCVLHYPPGPHLSSLSPLCWLTAQPSPTCRRRCAATDCLAALLSCRGADAQEAHQVLQLQRLWKGIQGAGRQPLWLRRVTVLGSGGLTVWDVPRAKERDIFTVDVPLRSDSRGAAAASSGRRENGCCSAAFAGHDTFFVFKSEGNDTKRVQKHLCLYTLPSDGL